MYIPFTCPNCGAFTEVETQFAGQSGPCYACGKTVTVPFAATGGKPPRPASGASLVTIGGIMALVAGGVMAFVALLAMLMWVLGPAINSGTSAAHKSACQSNLKLIASALDQYYQTYKSYPPAYTVSAQGKRLHSWRVLILPYLGETSTYSQFKLDEPWDSQHNIQAASRMPAVYGCPADISAKDNDETSYVVVVGKGTAFPGSKAVTRSQITDRLIDTVLVVEAHDSGIGWSEPKDLDASQMQYLVNGGSKSGGTAQEISSRHSGGASVLRADGETRFIDDKTAAEDVAGILTIAGKESITPGVISDDEEDF